MESPRVFSQGVVREATLELLRQRLVAVGTQECRRHRTHLQQFSLSQGSEIERSVERLTEALVRRIQESPLLADAGERDWLLQAVSHLFDLDGGWKGGNRCPPEPA